MFLFLSELQGEGHKGLSKVTAVGISIGSFVFGLFLSMALFYCHQKKKRRKTHSKEDNAIPLRSFENQAYLAAPLES